MSEDQSDDIYKELRVAYLRDLYIRSRKEFEQFRTMFNAISYDQKLLSDEYAKHFKKKLKNRINNIEDNPQRIMDPLTASSSAPSPSHPQNLLNSPGCCTQDHHHHDTINSPPPPRPSPRRPISQEKRDLERDHSTNLSPMAKRNPPPKQNEMQHGADVSSK